MKKLQFPQVSQKINCLKKAQKVFSIIVVSLVLLFSCSKDSPDPIPTPKPITRTVSNSITETQITPITVDGEVGEIKSIARYQGTALSGEQLVASFTVVGDSFTVTEHPNYPQDTLVLNFNQTGAGTIHQKLVSPQKVENEDINGDGVLDKTTFTSTEKEKITAVNSELVVEDVTNTVTLTNSTEIPATFEGTIGSIYEIPKLSGTAEVGEIVYNLSTNNDGLIEWLATTDETKLKFKVLAIGNVTITQTITSSDQTELLDTTGNGLADTQINYTGETKEEITNLEGVEVEFGLNAEGIAPLTEYFAGKIIEMEEGEVKHVELTELLNIPEGGVLNLISLNIEPRGAINFEYTDNGQVVTGINFYLKHEYRGTDLKIIFEAGISGENPVEVELSVPRGVSLDTSSPAEVGAIIKEQFLDLYTRVESGNGAEYINKWVGQSPDIFVYGATPEHMALLEEGMADKNNTLAEAGAVKEDGSPLRIRFVETAEESNVKLYFGDVDAFNAEFSLNVSGDGGRMARIFKDGDSDTHEVVGGGCYNRINWGGGIQGEVAGMIQELSQLMGMSGEIDEDATSISTIVAYNIIDNMKDKAAFMMLYNGNVPAAQQIVPGRVVDAQPLIDNLVEEVLPAIIEESDNL